MKNDPYPNGRVFSTVLVALITGINQGLYPRDILEILQGHGIDVTREQLVNTYRAWQEGRKFPNTIRGKTNIAGITDTRIDVLKRIIVAEHARQPLVKRGREDAMRPILNSLSSSTLRRRRKR